MQASGRPCIGIIGRGNVGSAPQDGLRKAGYQVEATGNDPAAVKKFAEKTEVVVLAVPYAERQNAARDPGGLGGKLVVDVTNGLDKDQSFAASTEKAGAEELPELASSAKVVKAFNTVLAQHMAKGSVNGETPTLFAAADDEAAKRTVLRMGTDLGSDGLHAGPLRNARWLETMGYLNIQLGYTPEPGPDSGFRYVHR